MQEIKPKIEKGKSNCCFAEVKHISSSNMSNYDKKMTENSYVCTKCDQPCWVVYNMLFWSIRNNDKFPENSNSDIVLKVIGGIIGITFSTWLSWKVIGFF